MMAKIKSFLNQSVSVQDRTKLFHVEQAFALATALLHCFLHWQAVRKVTLALRSI